MDRIGYNSKPQEVALVIQNVVSESRMEDSGRHPEEMGLQITAVTESSGHYVFNFSLVGRYVVTAEVRGLRAARFAIVTLEIGQTRSLGISLEVGSVEQTVEITESAASLDHNSATICRRSALQSCKFRST